MSPQTDEAGGEMRTCCDCGAKFFVRDGEIQFYADRELIPRKRCEKCLREIKGRRTYAA